MFLNYLSDEKKRQLYYQNKKAVTFIRFMYVKLIMQTPCNVVVETVWESVQCYRHFGRYIVHPIELNTSKTVLDMILHTT